MANLVVMALASGFGWALAALIVFGLSFYLATLGHPWPRLRARTLAVIGLGLWGAATLFALLLGPGSL